MTTTTTTPSLAFLLEEKGGGQGDEKRRSDPSSVAKEGDGRTTSVVVTTPFASVAARGGKGRRTVETSGASASVPSRDSMRGMRGGLEAGVVALEDRDTTMEKRERPRDRADEG